MHTPLLMLPGLNNSGPQHWQTTWQRRRADALRLEPNSWTAPELDDWMLALSRSIEACTVPPILVAHSMGCLLCVNWAILHRLDLSIRGAFLVAPPNFKRQEFPAPSFTQIPESPLPCPALVVASTNDPYCPIGVAMELAKKWETGFISVGERGHISTESGKGDWQEGWNLLEAFAAGLRVQI
ncbi:alpha/beta hydrolase [Granulicella sp. S190]|uniref:RBBP9/YdeN family alpha/beta hydrolase n=1 Tax=Granulicella sp. S190 TaxID=1747226 RepID=UPI00131C7B33|nr:alpha/beta hydrolase [Granulicella sp. S190]